MQVRLWHSNTYRLENTLSYGMERVWAIAVLKGTQKVCACECACVCVWACAYDALTTALRAHRLPTLGTHTHVHTRRPSGPTPTAPGLAI